MTRPPTRRTLELVGQTDTPNAPRQPDQQLADLSQQLGAGANDPVRCPVCGGPWAEADATTTAARTRLVSIFFPSTLAGLRERLGK